MEATSQLRQTSSDQAFDALKARVVTRSFGVRIGGFGVDYTSRKVEVDPEDHAARKQPDTARQAFQTEMERERLRREVVDAAWRERSQSDAASADGQAASLADSRADSRESRQTQARDSAVSHEDPLWRRGLSAYAKARDQLLADVARSRGTRLAVA